jgi:ribosomal protein L11 methyltransferase
MELKEIPDRIAICRPGKKVRPRPGELLIEIDRRGTFLPTHPTTKLCLDLLVRVARKGELRGRWLDVGSGSGVLAAACGALGAEIVVACDIDLWAIKVTKDNLESNGFHCRAFCFRGSTEALKGPFEGIVANLPASVLVEKAPSLDSLLGPRGNLVLSGLRDPEGQWLAKRMNPLGYEVEMALTRHETAIELPPAGSFTWTGLWLRRRP